MPVVRLTPRGSGCSTVVGDHPSQHPMAPGSLHGIQVVVADAEAASRADCQPVLDVPPTGPHR